MTSKGFCVLIGIKNKSEKVFLRQTFATMGEVIMVDSFEDWMEKVQQPKDVHLYVIDETLGKTMEMIALAQNLSTTKPPLLMVLTDFQDKDDNNKTKKPFIDRMSDLESAGVELFLHRPFILKQLQERAQQAIEWMQEVPPWLKILRASRQLIASNRSHDCLYALEKLQALMPKHLNLGLTLAKAYLKSGPTHVMKAALLLQELQKKYPNSVIVKDLLAGVHKDQSKLLENFSAMMKLVKEGSYKADLEEKIINCLRAFKADPEQFKKASEQLIAATAAHKMKPNTPGSLKALRLRVQAEILDQKKEKSDLKELITEGLIYQEKGLKDLKVFEPILERAYRENLFKEQSTLFLKFNDVVMPMNLEKWVLRFTTHLLEQNDAKTVEYTLMKLKPLGRLNPFYYASLIELHLSQNQIDQALSVFDTLKGLPAVSLAPFVSELGNIEHRIKQATKKVA